jgi:hypothetical protein
MVTLNEVLLMLYILSCLTIAITLGTFQRRGLHYHPLARLISLILIVSSGTIAILIMTGHYRTVGLPDTVVFVAFAAVVVLSGGNVMKIFRYSNPNKVE